MTEKLSTKIKELQFKQEELNQLIIELAETFCHISNADLKIYNINKEHFVMARSLVIEIHLLLEFYLDEYITNYFLNINEESHSFQDALQHGLKNKSFQESFLKNKKISFKDKILIFKKICRNPPKNYFTILEKINAIRNAFAHGYSITDKKFHYTNGKHIFCANNIFSLWDDAFLVVDFLKKSLNQVDENNLLYKAIKKRLEE